jgi:hypothetical protein
MFPSSIEIIREAYESGREIFKAELTEDEFKRTWVDSQPSIADVQVTVSQAAKLYSARSSSSTFKWITALSNRIVYYGALLDVLAQHHPEYVSLAWGAFKFLFIVGLKSPNSRN